MPELLSSCFFMTLSSKLARLQRTELEIYKKHSCSSTVVQELGFEKWRQRHLKSNKVCELHQVIKTYTHRLEGAVNGRHCLNLAPGHRGGNEVKFAVW